MIIEKTGQIHRIGVSIKFQSQQFLHRIFRKPSCTGQIDSKNLGGYSKFRVVTQRNILDSPICITAFKFSLSRKKKIDLPCRCFQGMRDTSATHKVPFQLEFPACMPKLQSWKGNKQHLFSSTENLKWK